jgi:hypothetical protein
MIILCAGHTGRSRMARSREPWTTPRQWGLTSMPSDGTTDCIAPNIPMPAVMAGPERPPPASRPERSLSNSTELPAESGVKRGRAVR